MRNYSRLDEWELYIPDIDNGREVFKTNPEEVITCEIKHLTRRELQTYLKASKHVANSNTITPQDERMVEQMFSECVRNVQNYTMNGEQISDGKQLYDLGETDIIGDIAGAIVSRATLDAGLAKKLNGRCDSSYVRRPKLGLGDVLDAIQALSLADQATLIAQIPRIDLAIDKSESCGDVTVSQEPLDLHGRLA